MFLCCLPNADLSPSFASVLVCGPDSLKTVLENIERKGLCPCVTGWCNYHHRLSVVNAYEPGDYPSLSAYYASLITFEKKIFKKE